MKKLSYVIILLVITLFCTSCATNRSPFQSYPAVTEVQLNQANWQIIGTAQGYSRQVYVFGIGGLSQKSLRQNAIVDMYENANLKGSQVIVNISTALTVSGVPPFYISKRASARGTIIEFLQENKQTSIISTENVDDTPQQNYADSSQVKIEDKLVNAQEMEYEEQNIDSLATLFKNKCYIALLLKEKELDPSSLKELAELFPYNIISSLANNNSKKDLIAYSAGHDKVFEKFSLDNSSHKNH